MSSLAIDNSLNPMTEIREGLRNGTVVPCLGPGALRGVVDIRDQSPIPADSDSLIRAMSGGHDMAPRLMYEFPRAAMHVENKKGRSFVERFLNQTYGARSWSESILHRWLADQHLPYIIDCNRDTQMQKLYTDRAHTLIVGTARIAGTNFRFDLYQWDGKRYLDIDQEQFDTTLPILFKPLGTPLPKPSYIASDADFVDYITELMGGFAVPAQLKLLRQGRRYVMLGMHFNRDTERMVLSDLIFGAATAAGWALIESATEKERRYCARQKLELIAADAAQLIATN